MRSVLQHSRSLEPQRAAPESCSVLRPCNRMAHLHLCFSTMLKWSCPGSDPTKLSGASAACCSLPFPASPWECRHMGSSGDTLLVASPGLYAFLVSQRACGG